MHRLLSLRCSRILSPSAPHTRLYFTSSLSLSLSFSFSSSFRFLPSRRRILGFDSLRPSMSVRSLSTDEIGEATEAIDWQSVRRESAKQFYAEQSFHYGRVDLTAHRTDKAFETTGIVVEYMDRNQRRLGILTQFLDKRRWVIRTVRDTKFALLEKFVQFQFPHDSQTIPYEIRDLERIIAKRNLMLEDLKQKIHSTWSAFQGHQTFTINDVAHHLYGQKPSIEQQYATHSFLLENWPYFKRVQRGIFECRGREDAAFRMRQKIALIHKDRLLDMFLLRLCTRLKQKFGYETTPYNFFKTESYLMQKINPHPKDLEWNEEKDTAFIWALVNYSIEDPFIGNLDPNVFERILSKFGVGLKPSDAFAFCQHVGILEEHTNIHLLRNPIPPPSSQVIGFAKKLAREEPKDPDDVRRVDMRGLDVFTIDDSSTQDIDDGISYDHTNHTVYVHIADPSIFTSKGNLLELRARQVATSSYLPEHTFHMFPPHITVNSMSLLAGRANKAFTIAVRMNPETGGLISYDIFPSTLHNVHRLNYKEVDLVLSGARQHPTLGTTAANLRMDQIDVLAKLLSIANAREHLRLSRGAVAINMPQIKPIVENNGQSIQLELLDPSQSSSQQIVSEMMILASEVIGLFCKTNQIPVLYRAQENPIVPPNADIRDIQHQYPPIVAAYMTSKFLNPAEMKPEPSPHYALQLEQYVQITSPIRRYGDLLAHMQVKSFLRGDSLPFTYDEICAMAGDITKKYRRAKELERRSTRFWTLKWVQQNGMDETYEAYIVDVMQEEDQLPFATLFFPKLATRAWVPFNRDIQLGDIVHMKPKSVAPYEDRFLLTDATQDDSTSVGEEY
eukprot:TRINITY_DN8905_c0_g2_i1.p2 TRINITY_DN8905_c0_g2~~TRINITY_DN8905_c0_g2_i1.p2  ORF type:complete len:844 (+),score=147.80 TRINITY_DN8905_c0_g2_i1:49-2580(+)